MTGYDFNFTFWLLTLVACVTTVVAMFLYFNLWGAAIWLIYTATVITLKPKRGESA